MDIANEVSQYFPFLIAAIAAANLLLWAWLIIYSRAEKALLADYLFNAVGLLSRRSDVARHMSIDERINVFMADIRDAVETGGENARKMLDRLMTKDEERLYLKTHRFERGYSIARSCIEIFPLLGIIGTVIAIAAGLNTSGASEADRVSQVVQNFGHSVWSTAAGLLAAIFFMILNAWFEPDFERLLGYAGIIREMIAHAKNRLGLAAPIGAKVP